MVCVNARVCACAHVYEYAHVHAFKDFTQIQSCCAMHATHPSVTGLRAPLTATHVDPIHCS